MDPLRGVGLPRGASGVAMSVLPIIASSRREPAPARRLRPPRGLAGALERGELLERIREGLNGQLVIIQAPPGFGKTELMLAAFQRLADPGGGFVWMTLDASDSDPRAFLGDLAIALGGDAPAWLGPEPVNIEALMRAVFARLPQEKPLAIFLDDFQLPTSEGFRDCVAQLLRGLPDHVTLVIASRRRPDIPLARLRLRNLLTEIHAEDLAFNRGECQAVLGAEVSVEDAMRLRGVTGGWPALVHLAIPLLRQNKDPKDRDKALAGGHPLFREFLDEELLPELPAPLRSALQACSILDEFPLALAADLADVEIDPDLAFDVGDFTPAIEPAPERPGWVRLSPILLSMLRERSIPNAPGAAAALHVRAARWFAERGILDKAVHHASHGGDFVLAAELIGRAGGVNIYLRLGYTVLERLLEDLPPAIVDQSPALRLCHAVALGKQGQVQAARAVVENLKRGASNADEDGFRTAIFKADLDHIDALIDCYEDQRLGETRIAELEMAAEDHASHDRWQRSWIYNHLSASHIKERSDLFLARRAGLRALASYREQKSPYAQVFMLAHLGTVLIHGGRLAAAVKVLRGADHLVQETQWTDENLAAVVHIPQAMATYLHGNIAEAERMLTQAMPIVSRGEGWVDSFENGFTTLARARFLLQGFEAGLAVLDQAEELAVERDLPRLQLSMSVTRVDLLARGGLLESARDQLQRLPPLSTDPERLVVNLTGWPTWRERLDALIAQARLFALSGLPEAALDVLDAVIADAREREAGLDLLVGEILSTEALWALDRFDEIARLAATLHCSGETAGLCAAVP